MLNLNGVFIDMDTIISKYNGKMQSVTDSIEIQQISLFCQQNNLDYRKAVLLDMISPKFSFAGLYPHVMKSHDIIPEDTGVYNKEDMKKVFDSSHKFSTFESYMYSLSCERKKFKDSINQINDSIKSIEGTDHFISISRSKLTEGPSKIKVTRNNRRNVWS